MCVNKTTNGTTNAHTYTHEHLERPLVYLHRLEGGHQTPCDKRFRTRCVERDFFPRTVIVVLLKSHHQSRCRTQSRNRRAGHRFLFIRRCNDRSNLLLRPTGTFRDANKHLEFVKIRCMHHRICRRVVCSAGKGPLCMAHTGFN